MPNLPNPGPMQLARFFLPLQDNAGEAFPAEMYSAIEAELSSRFGGVTAHLQSPASGSWRDGGKLHADDVVIFEILLEKADMDWWRAFRARLERDFRQARILLMLQPVEIV